jgi:hypothetical protein
LAWNRLSACDKTKERKPEPCGGADIGWGANFHACSRFLNNNPRERLQVFRRYSLSLALSVLIPTDLMRPWKPPVTILSTPRRIGASGAGQSRLQANNMVAAHVR